MLLYATGLPPPVEMVAAKLLNVSPPSVQALPAYAVISGWVGGKHTPAPNDATEVAAARIITESSFFMQLPPSFLFLQGQNTELPVPPLVAIMSRIKKLCC